MKTFNTFEEIIEDAVFKQSLDQLLSDYRKKRYNREPAKPGYKYVRDWYDRMTDEGKFNTTFFLNNIVDIWLKCSTLSSEFRQVIMEFCDQAANKMYEYHEPDNKEVENDVNK